MSAFALPKWGKVIDQSRCIGCHACSTACKSENEVPLSVARTYVKYVEVGTYPATRRAFQVTRCNQCEESPCTVACPTAAMHRRDDGIVDFDKSICIGCKACIAACPYDAIFINPTSGTAEKCNFCAHRLDVGLEPACVVVCPTEALMVGDLNDADSRVSQLVGRDVVTVRRPEKGTRPKVFYKGAHQATLDPLAARRPDGGMFMWSEQGNVDHQVPSGHPGGANSSAAALLAYDVPHRAPWDYRVSLYTFTKSVAAGAYLLPALLVLFGLIDPAGDLWRWITPIVSGAFLAITGAILTWDLDKPTRFIYIFTKHQWRSWLVRGAFIITGFGAVLGAHFLANFAGQESLQKPLAYIGAPLALMTAIYTAYLFAQAKGRDLWQSPLLAPHLAIQALLAGAAALMLADAASADALARLLAIAAGIHVLFTLGEITTAHPTEHARLAASAMTSGKYATFFWLGLAGTTIAIAAPWIGIAAAPLALLGLLAHEHAYVQAGQSVPLA